MFFPTTFVSSDLVMGKALRALFESDTCAFACQPALQLIFLLLSGSVLT